MAQNSPMTPAPFLKKTYQLVEDSATDDIVSWGVGGKTFVVSNATNFAINLLPVYFKHNNFSSLIRQLNTYKVVPDKWEFGNENFIKVQPELLLQIRWRKAVPPQAGIPSSSGSGGEDAGSISMSSPTTSNNGGIHRTTELSDENEKLKRANDALSTEVARAKR